MNIYVLELAKALAAKGIPVDIFTRSTDPDNPLIVPVIPGLRVIHLPAGPQSPQSKKQIRQYIPDFVQNILAFAQKEEAVYSVMHCHYYLSGLVGQELQHHWSATPIVMSFHTLALMKNLVARTTAEMEDADRVEAEMELVQESEVIISPSESDQQYLHYLYAAPADKVLVIPPGVDTHLFKPMDQLTAKKYIGADVDHKVILFVGRIEPLKGLDVLMYSMKILRQRNPELQICLWIVGGDTSVAKTEWSAELQKLEKVRELLHLTSSVLFINQKPQVDLPYYYNAAELVVMPSHYESFGMAAAEAMACGVPVITTNVTGVSTILDAKHEPLVTSANNPLLLADQMEHLLTDPQARQRMSEAVLTKIQDLNWEDIAQEISAAYQKVADD